MDSLGHRAILPLHLADLGEQDLLPVGLVLLRLQLLGALLHRRLLLGGEPRRHLPCGFLLGYGETPPRDDWSRLLDLRDRATSNPPTHSAPRREPESAGTSFYGRVSGIDPFPRKAVDPAANPSAARNPTS